jgi:hypothetical protein
MLGAKKSLMTRRALAGLNPGLAQALGIILRDGDTLVVWKIDKHIDLTKKPMPK